MQVTKTLEADFNRELLPVIKQAEFLRADLWRRYGALQTMGNCASAIRKEITKGNFYSGLPMDGTIRAETTKDVVNDIFLYKAAAQTKVRKTIALKPNDQQKELYALLKSDRWLEDNFLHRQMRKHFKHGVSSTNNQFIVRSDKFTTGIVEGRLTITIKIAKKYGQDIVLRTTSTGKNVDLEKTNLRIIVKLGFVEIHFAANKEEGRPCGNNHIGVDKGYTEAFTDSEGEFHGIDFGKLLTEYSDKQSQTGKARNKLHALEKKHRKAGNQAKADRVKNNNLGRKKLDSRNKLTKKRLRNIAFKAAHSIVDKANVIAVEDLTSPIANKKPWKKFNRRMSSWAKGVLAESLDSVTEQREAHLELVNCAYTSQMDSIHWFAQR